MKTLLFLLVPSILVGKELTACYEVYFSFIPVAESCVIYSEEGNRFRVKAWAKTKTVARIVKPVNSWGRSELVNMKVRGFTLFQREGSYVRYHSYTFESKGIRYRIVRYKKEGDTVKEGFFTTSSYLLDPFSATLLIYIDTPNFRGGALPVFYDAKIQSIKYRTLGEEDIEVFGKKYRTWKVLLVPEFDTKGLLRPKGEWHLWVDKDTSVPVKLDVGFSIGRVKVYLKRIDGYRMLLKEARDEQAGVF